MAGLKVGECLQVDIATMPESSWVRLEGRGPIQVVDFVLHSIYDWCIKYLKITFGV